eukprot:SAG11_NODE_13999_length_629_cov_1.105660_1_plen_177_part_10
MHRTNGNGGAGEMLALSLQLLSLRLLVLAAVILASVPHQLGATAATWRAAPVAPPRCSGRPHTFVGSALSPPTGRNTPHQCPACRGQSVLCEGCGNIIPMSTESGELPELTNWSASVGPLAEWAKATPPGARTLYGPSYGTVGEGSNGRPEWAGVVNPLTGETGPGGHEILGNASCG